MNITHNFAYDEHSPEVHGNTNQVILSNNLGSVRRNLSGDDRVLSPGSCEYSYSSINNLHKERGHAETKSVIETKSVNEKFYFNFEKLDNQTSENEKLDNTVNKPAKYSNQNEYEYFILDDDDGPSAGFNPRSNLPRFMDPALTSVYDHLHNTPATRRSNDKFEDCDHTRAYSRAVFPKGTKCRLSGADIHHYDTALTPHAENTDYYDHTTAFSRPIVDNTYYDTTAVAHHRNTELRVPVENRKYKATLTPQTNKADEYDLVEASFDHINYNNYYGKTPHQKKTLV